MYHSSSIIGFHSDTSSYICGKCFEDPKYREGSFFPIEETLEAELKQWETLFNKVNLLRFSSLQEESKLLREMRELLNKHSEEEKEDGITLNSLVETKEQTYPTIKILAHQKSLAEIL